MQEHKKNLKPQLRFHSKNRSRDIGFFSFSMLWVVMSSLCFFGIIVFDARSISGAMLSGLILSASIAGTMKLLRKLYDAIYH